MIIIGFGLNHKTAPLALLERTSFAPEGIVDFLGSVCDGVLVHEAFGLSTCNRTEFLLCTSDPERAHGALLSQLETSKGVELAPQLDKTFFHTDEKAIRHIFEVACGIDSLVVGENEILGQLRRAREAASDAGHISDILDPILLRAIDIGRRARQTTGISRGNVSVASVAATLAIRTLGGDLSTKKGVILGAGKTAEAAALQMSERGLKDLTIANRTFERAFRVASAMGAREASLDDVGKLLQDADVVVCATSGQHFVVTVPMMNSAMGSRCGKPIILLDLSVPRNIDPEVVGIEGVHLYSLEHLSQVADENRAQREMQTRAVQQLIDEEIAAWHGLRQTSDNGRLVAALHRRMENVRRLYVERHGHHFSPEEQQQLDMFSSGLTRSLLHELVENLRTLDLDTAEGQRRYEFARELFNVTDDRPE